MSKFCYNNEDENLLYAAKGTQLDTAHAVSLLCQFCSKPAKVHWNEMKYIMRYLTKFKGAKLHFVHPENSKFIGYCNFVGCPDDRRSMTGFVFKFANATITW